MRSVQELLEAFEERTAHLRAQLNEARMKSYYQPSWMNSNPDSFEQVWQRLNEQVAAEV